VTARFSVVLLLAATAFAADPQRLTLQEAERIALQANPRVGAARFSAMAAGQVPAEYRANYLPQFFGNITGAGASDGSRIAAGGLNNPVIYDRLASGLTVSQMITDFGRTANLTGSASLSAKAADQNAEAVRAQVVLLVDRAYYNLLKAQNVLTVAQQTVKERQLVVDQITALAQSKLKSSLDVSFAQVNLSEAKLTLASAENDVRSVSAELSAALGYAGQRSFQLVEENLPGPVNESLDALVHEAMDARPELRDLRLRESAAQRFAKAERALSFPTISTVATAGYVPARVTQLHSNYGAAGLNVNLPVFNGGLFSARRREAEFKAAAASQQVKDAANQVARDVRIAYLAAQTAYERVGLTAQMLDQAKLALDLAQTRYKIGLGSIVELSQAQLSETSAEIASVSAKYDYQAQRALLAFETGTNR
jgi:outer membrane protein